MPNTPSSANMNKVNHPRCFLMPKKLINHIKEPDEAVVLYALLTFFPSLW